MSRRAGFTLQHAKRAVAPFFFEGWFAIGLLFTAALAITLALTGVNATADSLFQSPQSPQSPVEVQVPQPVQAAPPVNPPAATEPQLIPDAPAPDAAVPPAGGEPQPAPEGEVPLPPPLPEPERRPARDTETPPGDDAQMVLDQAEFIDTVVVSFAYVWLCCGIVLMLVIPLIFLFLHIRGRSKMIKEEQF